MVWKIFFLFFGFFFVGVKGRGWGGRGRGLSEVTVLIGEGYSMWELLMTLNNIFDKIEVAPNSPASYILSPSPSPKLFSGYHHLNHL